MFWDHAYWPSGLDWKEYRVFKDLQLGWEAFANEYDDGTIEWGHLCLGREGFNFAGVADQHGAVVMDSGVTGGIDLGDDDWAQRQRWKASSGRSGPSNSRTAENFRSSPLRAGAATARKQATLAGWGRNDGSGSASAGWKPSGIVSARARSRHSTRPRDNGSGARQKAPPGNVRTGECS